MYIIILLVTSPEFRVQCNDSNVGNNLFDLVTTHIIMYEMILLLDEVAIYNHFDQFLI